MDKHQILSQISEILEIANLQTREFVLHPEKFSAIEADLIKDYLRIAYDKLNVLTYLVAKENSEKEINQTENPVETENNIQNTISESKIEQPIKEKDPIISLQVDQPFLKPIVTQESENEEEKEPITVNKPTENKDDNQLDFVWNLSKNEETTADSNNEIKGPTPSNQPTLAHIVAENFHENENTVIGKIEKETNDNSVLSKVSKIRIDELKKAIGINDRFLFINELFKGNISSYNQFIDELDKFDDSLQAWEYIEKMKSKKSWDSASSAYKHLFEIVERKFL